MIFLFVFDDHCTSVCVFCYVDHVCFGFAVVHRFLPTVVFCGDCRWIPLRLVKRNCTREWSLGLWKHRWWLSIRLTLPALPWTVDGSPTWPRPPLPPTRHLPVQETSTSLSARPSMPRSFPWWSFLRGIDCLWCFLFSASILPGGLLFSSHYFSYFFSLPTIFFWCWLRIFSIIWRCMCFSTCHSGFEFYLYPFKARLLQRSNQIAHFFRAILSFPFFSSRLACLI